MSYEEALRGWASTKYGFDPESVESVSISFREGYGGGCDTCDYGRDDGGMTVRIRFFNDVEDVVKEFGFYEFDTLLRDIVEAGSQA